MDYQRFPGWRYSPTDEPCIVDSREAELGLVGAWFERPDLTVPISRPGRKHRKKSAPVLNPPMSQLEVLRLTGEDADGDCP